MWVKFDSFVQVHHTLLSKCNALVSTVKFIKGEELLSIFIRNKLMYVDKLKVTW